MNTNDTFFAVQFKRGEATDHVAEAVLRVAADMGTAFSRLEALDTLPYGTGKYVRFRADLINPWPILERLLAEGRGIVGQGSTYVVKLVDGRTGTVAFTTMQAVARSPRMYRATAVPFWERQFEASV